ncbi:sugar phosphate isomerase/epimerase family protein [Alienimonas californiensis]|uniref:Xylose isomerase-like TIM barrel n=1 Tax=Alienimonas californiensis TaxID=2527989 RepID=A0A517PF85_9PLAN|nr:TIM barrel protein [Alienimonas californiensis]QDT18029.1 Xylose isomerase-like TIM barrel [Alienimonas californiensis]
MPSAPKLHNAAWPGLVGKEPGTDNPPIDLETMLDHTAKAEVNGQKFDGIDLFLFDPHVSIDADRGELEKLAEQVGYRNLVVGSVVAPVWEPTGGGSAMDPGEGRKKFLTQIRKACHIAKELREIGIRRYGVVRIDSATPPADWVEHPEIGTKAIAETFREAAKIAEDHGERLAAEGEICWAGMHSWREMINLLEAVDRPKVVGFQADMAHTLLYLMGYNAPDDALLPRDFDWSDTATLDAAYAEMTEALRPWTIDFHVAQNDATVHGTGSHDKTGRHCLPNDPNGKLEIAKRAGAWLDGAQDRGIKHICWDGCMFPNDVMAKEETWNSILEAMIAVRDAHGWD